MWLNFLFLKHHNDEVGFNSCLDKLQAELLRAKLPCLAGYNARRALVARQYLDGLAGLPGLVLPNAALPAGSSNAWHLFVVRHTQSDRLAAALAEAGVGTVIHYPVAPHLQPEYATLNLPRGSLPVSERLHAEVLSLPIGPTQTAAQTQQVISVLREAVMRLAGVTRRVSDEPAAAL